MQRKRKMQREKHFRSDKKAKKVKSPPKHYETIQNAKHSLFSPYLLSKVSKLYTLSFQAVFSVTGGPPCWVWGMCNGNGQTPTKTLCRIHTEESGQRGVHCRLHLKPTSPQEALVVQSERWRRSFHWLGEKEREREGIKRGSDYPLLVREVFIREHAWATLSICLSETWLMARPKHAATLIILLYWK